MQIGSGHFSMWGDGDYVNPLITPYVVEFLLDAREAGFAVPDTMLQKALKVLNEDLLSGGAPFFGYDRRDHLKFAYQAYAGYVLARVNRAPLGTLRALYDNERKQSLTGLPLVHLGLALSLQGDKARGGKAIAEGFARDSSRAPRVPGRLRQPPARRCADDRAGARARPGHAGVRRARRAAGPGARCTPQQRLDVAEHAGAGRAGATGQGADWPSRASRCPGQWKVGDVRPRMPRRRVSSAALFDYAALLPRRAASTPRASRRCTPAWKWPASRAARRSRTTR